MALSISRSLVALGGAAILGLLVFVGCQSVSNPGTSTAPVASGKGEKGGAQLWAETCSHCHNLRSPATYGPAQWEVAVYDMRVRAHLTGEEQRKILEFLKAASQ